MNRVLSLLFILSGGLTLRAAGPATVSFENDVLPVLTRAGCMAGSCHAKADGQNGFQLSIFSFDPNSDYREIVYDARGRRIFPSSPDHSLLLLKATNAVPHEGEKRFEKGSEFYNVLRQWIAEGAPRRLENEPDPTGIAIEPAEAAFKKGDKKMDKGMPSKSADMKMDKALAKKVKGSCSCGKCASCKAKKKK
jgi:hypothetical protein